MPRNLDTLELNIATFSGWSNLATSWVSLGQLLGHNGSLQGFHMCFQIFDIVDEEYIFVNHPKKCEVSLLTGLS